MKIIKEGRPFILAPFAAFLLFVFVPQLAGASLPVAISCLFWLLGAAFLLFALFCLFFFRDPNIKIGTSDFIEGEKIILSACNGTVMEINENKDENVVRVFLSIFNVHLQRSPIHGTVKTVEYKEGKFLMAWDPSAHDVNEQNIITIENEYGTFAVQQISGFLARRCVSWVKAGDALKMGDKIGCIKFGSQVDLHVPKICEITVKPGDKVRAGITVMGKIIGKIK